MERLAVVLFNLGGPDSLEAVEPFLFNLFNDPAIIGGAKPFRWAMAKFVSRRRAKVAREIYRKLDGESPLLDETQAQAKALQRRLADQADDVRIFIAMRYWHPMSGDVAREVKTFQPDEIILLPLYPQFSTTTTGSSLAAWHRAALAVGLNRPTRAVCCYPKEPGFIQGQAKLIAAAMEKAESSKWPHRPRMLFSAHGLPKKIVARGDPYQWQVEQTSRAVAEALQIPDLDWTVCYQSRIGPLEWIGPSIDDELSRAGKNGVPVIVVPIAFVSEHSETLVELDIEYRDMAHGMNVPAYRRVPALGCQEDFINGLGRLVETAGRRDIGTGSADGGRQCPAGHAGCPLVEF